MIKIAQSLGELRDSIIYLTTNCNAKDYPTEFQPYDEGWDSLSRSLEYLRGKLGEDRYVQLVEMATQAKARVGRTRLQCAA